LQKGKLEIFGTIYKMIKNCNTIKDVFGFVKFDEALPLRLIFGEEELVKITVKFRKNIVDEIIVEFGGNLRVLKGLIVSS
jgi:hypothetical protein